MKLCPRKIITRVIVFLLLGAIVNVAVAWGCSYFGTISATGEPPMGIKEGDGPNTPPLEFAFEFTPEWRSERNGIGQSRVRFIDDYLHKPLYIAAEEYRAGWPLLSLYGEWWVATGPHHGPSRGGHAGRYIVNEPIYEKYVLPYLPLWPGFAINTIFYAAILWLMFLAPGSVRRAFRRRRVLCPACAYPVGTSPVCTECGTKLPLPREGEGRGEGA